MGAMCPLSAGSVMVAHGATATTYNQGHHIDAMCPLSAGSVVVAHGATATIYH
jgi:alkylated DNA repair dioxygenase AlkB